MSAEDPLLGRQETLRLLGRYDRGYGKLKTALGPAKLLKVQGKWQDCFQQSRVEAVACCLRNTDALTRNKHVDPSDGHLWLLAYRDKAKQALDVIDLCAGGDTSRRFLIAAAARKHNLPVMTLDYAARKPADQPGHLPSIRVYGTGGGAAGLFVVSDRDVVAFKRNWKPVTNVNGDEWKPASGLAATVRATEKVGCIEVTQCARLWGRMGLVRSKAVCLGQRSMVPAPGGRELRPVTTRRQGTLYDVKQFREQWARPLDLFVAEAKRIVPWGQRVPATAVRSKLKEMGIIGERFQRVARLAGLQISRKGAQHASFYERRYNRPTPIKKQRPLQATVDWLRGKLRRPMPAALIRHLAAKAHIERKSLLAARKQLNCTRLWAIPRSGQTVTAGDIRLFWGLPGQLPPTPDEARRAVAAYRKLVVLDVQDGNSSSGSAELVNERVAAQESQPRRLRGRQKGWTDTAAARRRGEIIAAKRSGRYKDNQAIADAFGCTREYVSRVVNKAGLGA